MDAAAFPPSITGILALARKAPEEGAFVSSCDKVGFHLGKLACAMGRAFCLYKPEARFTAQKIALAYLHFANYDELTTAIISVGMARTQKGGILIFGAYPEQHSAVMAVLESFPKPQILFNTHGNAYVIKS